MSIIYWIIKNKQWLFSGIGVAVIFFVLGILTPSHKDKEQQSKLVNNILNADVKTLVNNMYLPVYVTNAEFKVIHCNKEFLSFIGLKYNEVVGKPVLNLIERFAELVPDERREAFIKRQSEVLKDGKKAPYAEITEIVDFGRRKSIQGRGIYEVLIHALFINSPKDNKELGSVVIYYPKPLKQPVQ